MDKNDELCEFLHDVVHVPLWQARVECFEGVAKAFSLQTADEWEILLRGHRKKIWDLMDAGFTSHLGFGRRMTGAQEAKRCAATQLACGAAARAPQNYGRKYPER